MALYQGRYRVESARLPDYDYTSEGWYHVVLCTQGRALWFGEVVNGIMGLSSVGCIVVDEWLRTPHVRPYVVVDEWVAMPNHVHGILGLTATDSNPVETARWAVSPVRPAGGASSETPHRGVSTGRPAGGASSETPHRGVSTGRPVDISNTETPHRGVSTRGLASRSLGAIIGQTKAACTRRIRAAGYQGFAWQPRFFDRVIRTDRELEDTRLYIHNNPATWEMDRLHPDAPVDPPPTDSAIEL